MLFRSRMDNVSVWGNQNYGQTGYNFPMPVHRNGNWGASVKPVSLSAYNGHYTITTSNGWTYAFGANTNEDGTNQMGVSNGAAANTVVNDPMPILKAADYSERSDVPYYYTDITTESMDNILAVSVGNAHTIIQRIDGSLYGVGRNSEGQLGSYLRSAYGVTLQDGANALINDNPANRYYPYRVGAQDFHSLYLNEAMTVGGTQVVLNEKEQSYVTIKENQTLSVDMTKATLEYVPGFKLFNEDAVTVNDTNGLKNNRFLAWSSNENVASVTVNGSTITVIPNQVDNVNYGYGETNILIAMVGNEETNYVHEYGMIHITVIQNKDGKMAAPKIATGNNFTVSLKSDGTMWA